MYRLNCVAEFQKRSEVVSQEQKVHGGDGQTRNSPDDENTGVIDMTHLSGPDFDNRYKKNDESVRGYQLRAQTEFMARNMGFLPKAMTPISSAKMVAQRCLGAQSTDRRGIPPRGILSEEAGYGSN